MRIKIQNVCKTKIKSQKSSKNDNITNRNNAVYKKLKGSTFVCFNDTFIARVIKSAVVFMLSFVEINSPNHFYASVKLLLHTS